MLRANAVLRRYTNAETGYYFKEGSTIPSSLKPGLPQGDRLLSPLAHSNENPVDSRPQSQTRETRWRFQRENIQAQDIQRPLIRYNSVWRNCEIPIEQRIKFIPSGTEGRGTPSDLVPKDHRQLPSENLQLGGLLHRNEGSNREEKSWKDPSDPVYIEDKQLRRTRNVELSSYTRYESAPVSTEKGSGSSSRSMVELFPLELKDEKDPREDVISVLRSLLRECTYLPDPNARKYIKEHILERFKKYKKMHDQKLEGIPSLSEQRSRQQLAEAQKGLKILYRCNTGHNKALTQVLLMTYGRSGKRRYALMKPLTKPDPSYVDVITKSVKHHRLGSSPGVAEKVPRFTQQLEALLESQRITKPKLLTAGINPRTPAPSPAKLNARMRQTAHTRVKNELKGWYATTMARMLPPLPASEWEELSKRATGEIKFVPLKPRIRARAQLRSKNWRPRALLESLGIVEFSKGKANKDRPHTYTSRFMRRLWERVFMMCPVMEWDASADKWNVQWGTVSKLRKRQRIRQTSGDLPVVEFAVKLGDFNMKKDLVWKTKPEMDSFMTQGEWELKESRHP